MNIGQVLKDSLEFLGKYPTLLLVPFFSVLMREFQVIYDSLTVGVLIYLVELFLLFLGTQYVYEAFQGNPSWKAALRVLKSKWFVLTIATLIFYIAFFPGLILLVIPGIIVLVRLGCYDYAVLFDGAGILDSLKRSWGLTKGSFWRIFFLRMILFIPCMFCQFIPRTEFLLPLDILIQTFFLSWLLVTMVLVYLQLKKMEDERQILRPSMN